MAAWWWLQGKAMGNGPGHGRQGGVSRVPVLPPVPSPSVPKARLAPQSMLPDGVLTI